MSYITATLAAWSKFPTVAGDGWTGKVTKANMRRALQSDNPRVVEFDAIATPFQRSGYFFIDEVPGQTIELRFNHGMGLMMIEVGPDGKVKAVR